VVLEDAVVAELEATVLIVFSHPTDMALGR